MQNTDTRIQVTKSMFQRAMLELLEEKPVGSVTVKELCERAGLNRGTFYLHYSEPIDVLHELETVARNLVMSSAGGGFYKDLPDLLAAIRENSRLISVVISHNGDPAFLRRVRDEEFERSDPKLLKRFPGSKPENIRLAFDFLFSGSTGAITAWLQEKVPEPTDQFEKRLSLLVESVFNTIQVM